MKKKMKLEFKEEVISENKGIQKRSERGIKIEISKGKNRELKVE